MTSLKRSPRALALLMLAAWALPAPAARAQTTPTTDPADGGRDVSKRGLTAASFLSLPVGARATGMGGALVASVNDASAIYWNPSGLAGLRSGTFAAEYAQWFDGIDFNHVAVALPIAGGTVGAAVTAVRVGDMEETTVEQPDGTGEQFDAAMYAFSLSYARQLTDRFSIGGTGKFINERYSASSANGFAVDIGTTFVTPLQGIRLGASISNFGSKMQIAGADLRTRVDADPVNSGNGTGGTAQFETDEFDLPLTMRIGLAGEVYRAGGNRITLALDGLSPNNAQQYLNAGAEVSLLNDLVMLRGGYSELLLKDAVHGFTFGGGLRYGFGDLRLALDYAYEQSRWLDNVNRFTVAVGF